MAAIQCGTVGLCDVSVRGGTGEVISIHHEQAATTSKEQASNNDEDDAATEDARLAALPNTNYPCVFEVT